jgi:flagellar motor protein MotB
MYKILFLIFTFLASVFDLTAQTPEQIAKDNIRLQIALLKQAKEAEKKIRILQDSIKKNIGNNNNKSLESQLKEEKAKVKSYINNVKKLEVSNDSLKIKYQHLETATSREIYALKTEKFRLEAEVAKLNTLIDEKQGEIDSLKKELSVTKRELDSVNLKLKDMTFLENKKTAFENIRFDDNSFSLSIDDDNIVTLSVTLLGIEDILFEPPIGVNVIEKNLQMVLSNNVTYAKKETPISLKDADASKGSLAVTFYPNDTNNKEFLIFKALPSENDGKYFSKQVPMEFTFYLYAPRDNGKMQLKKTFVVRRDFINKEVFFRTISIK